MFKHAYYIESTNHNPHQNLALEEALFDSLPEDSIIFYLWQNAHTVVIGKNQNAHKECVLDKMEAEHCTLARRSTGGGAVYHDLGNLNFSFITSEATHSIAKQSSVILDCLEQFGIEAVLSGRNDIEVEGRKISGNAYLTRDQKKLHHGTLMIDVNTDIMGKYLKPSNLKLQAKGVDSVRSRVANIKEFNSSVTIPLIIEKLKTSFEKVYHLPLLAIEIPSNYTDYYQHYQSKEFVFGELSSYTHYLERRFDFGEVNLYYTLQENQVKQMITYSDTMDLSIVPEITLFFENMDLNEISFQKRFQENQKPYLHELYMMMEETKDDL